MANTHPQELPVPPAAQQDSRAIELVRVWAAQGAQHVTLKPNLWPDVGTWGIALVDLARHAARAQEQTTGESYELVLNRIKAVFDAEWSHPTDNPRGKLLE